MGGGRARAILSPGRGGPGRHAPPAKGRDPANRRKAERGPAGHDREAQAGKGIAAQCAAGSCGETQPCETHKALADKNGGVSRDRCAERSESRGAPCPVRPTGAPGTSAAACRMAGRVARPAQEPEKGNAADEPGRWSLASQSPAEEDAERVRSQVAMM